MLKEKCALIIYARQHFRASEKAKTIGTPDTSQRVFQKKHLLKIEPKNECFNGHHLVLSPFSFFPDCQVFGIDNRKNHNFIQFLLFIADVSQHKFENWYLSEFIIKTPINHHF